MAQHTLIDRKCVDFFFFFSLLSRRRRHQPTVMDEREQKVSTGWEGWEGVIWLNFHTPCIFCLRRGKERHIRTRPSTVSPKNFFRRRRCGQSTYDHERKRADVIKAVGTVVRGYFVKSYQRRAYDGKAADDHRRGRAEPRRYQRRAYDGKAADDHRRGRAESRR